MDHHVCGFDRSHERLDDMVTGRDMLIFLFPHQNLSPGGSASQHDVSEKFYVRTISAHPCCDWEWSWQQCLVRSRRPVMEGKWAGSF